MCVQSHNRPPLYRGCTQSCQVVGHRICALRNYLVNKHLHVPPNVTDNLLLIREIMTIYLVTVT